MTRGLVLSGLYATAYVLFFGWIMPNLLGLGS